MGMKIIPEQSVRFYYLAKEFVRGNHREKNNPLRWDRKVLNLLGSKEYNPSFPWIYKWDDVHERISGEILAYVDDLHAIGFSLEEAWRIARWMASKLQYLGIQDAPRKRRIDNGPWAGSVVNTKNTSVSRTVEQKKWEKAQGYINELVNQTNEGANNKLNYKRLEQIRGFMCHLAMMYELLNPYLKGFHLTLASHLPKLN